MSLIAVTTNLQIPEKIAYNVISNLQLLLKLSPYWDVKSLLPILEPSAQTFNKFEAIIKYYTDDTPKALAIEVDLPQNDKSFSFKMVGNGIEKNVEISLVPNLDGSISISQSYRINPPDEAIAESLSLELKYWHRAIIEYLKLQNGRGIWKKCFRWFMDKVWLNLTLSERKIAIILVKISILEIIILVALVIIWRVIYS